MEPRLTLITLGVADLERAVTFYRDVLGWPPASVLDDVLRWKNYPNAFERIAGVLDHPHSGTVWVTAKAGCEFEVPGTAAHFGGGSHGALHVLESVCPVIVAGPTTVNLPTDMRSSPAPSAPPAASGPTGIFRPPRRHPAPSRPCP